MYPNEQQQLPSPELFQTPDIAYGAVFRWTKGEFAGKIVSFKQFSYDVNSNKMIACFADGTKIPMEVMYDYLQPTGETGYANDLVDSMYDVDSMNNRGRNMRLTQGLEYDETEFDKPHQKKINHQEVSGNPVYILLNANKSVCEIPMVLNISCNLPDKSLVETIKKSFVGCEKDLVEYLLERHVQEIQDRAKAALIEAIKQQYDIDWVEPVEEPEIPEVSEILEEKSEENI